MMKQQQLAKQAENYEAERKEESEFEQKPVLKFNEFDDEEEKEIKEQQRKKTRKLDPACILVKQVYLFGEVQPR